MRGRWRSGGDGMNEKLDWIAVDWGSTRIRAVALGPEGVIAAAEAANTAPPGAGGHEAALVGLIGGWLAPGHATLVIACGMIGARHGWTEAKYRVVPAGTDPAETLVRAPAVDPRLDLRIVPGLSQDRPADVMRGEETQIAGFIAGNPDFDGVICLPGTHSKWARVSAREVVGFRTAMTGELFALLSTQSVLRHGMAAGGEDPQVFLDGVSRALSRPERLATELFSIRAEGLLHDLSPGAARSRLSGILIGAELAAMRPFWLGQRVAVVGAPGVARAYAQALGAQGAVAECAEGADMALAGLAMVRARIRSAGA